MKIQNNAILNFICICDILKTHNLNSPESKQDSERVWADNKKAQKWDTAYDVLWKALDVFWERTNISGLCNAKSSNSSFQTTAWMVIFAVFTVFTFTGLRDVIDDYLTYPVETFVTVEHRNQVCKITFHISCFSSEI